MSDERTMELVWKRKNHFMFVMVCILWVRTYVQDSMGAEQTRLQNQPSKALYIQMRNNDIQLQIKRQRSNRFNRKIRPATSKLQSGDEDFINFFIFFFRHYSNGYGPVTFLHVLGFQSLPIHVVPAPLLHRQLQLGCFVYKGLYNVHVQVPTYYIRSLFICMYVRSWPSTLLIHECTKISYFVFAPNIHAYVCIPNPFNVYSGTIDNIFCAM